MRRVFVAGGAGFIGSNFIRHLMRERPDAEIVNFDALTYAGNPANLAESRRTRVTPSTVTSPTPRCQRAMRDCDAVVNFFRDARRSLDRDASDFMETNIRGAYNVLSAA
jgi:dTDP-glucose 4,6-dehydratase